MIGQICARLGWLQKLCASCGSTGDEELRRRKDRLLLRDLGDGVPDTLCYVTRYRNKVYICLPRLEIQIGLLSYDISIFSLRPWHRQVTFNWMRWLSVVLAVIGLRIMSKARG